TYEGTAMKEKILNNSTKASAVIFFILIIVHAFEAIFLRMDETFFAENFINKLFGIAVMFVVLKILQWKCANIGFSFKGFFKNIAIGILLSVFVFAIAYSVEFFILKARCSSVELGFYTVGFSLAGESAIHKGIGFILMCIFFNIINVIMEEGTFRGLFYQIVKTNHSMKFSLIFQALLFGVWHIVTPLHNFIDGDINLVSFIALSVGYIILAGLMGIKWGLMYQLTGSLYSGMADHFFNNCIATNLLHLSTENGIDEMMIVRVLIAQLVSFFIVLFVWIRKNKKDNKAELSNA
ncbi:MAG: CPBP family intramembrane metalloprotease, partial [Clostridiales bacterium]|nr:CPBP family intramembrane metalloprotease [Clostridiales bacterium]